MAAGMLQVIHRFYRNNSHNSNFSANTNKKIVVSKQYYIACHDGKLCFLPTRKYHIIILGDDIYQYSYSIKLIVGNRKKNVLVHHTP